MSASASAPTDRPYDAADRADAALLLSLALRAQIPELLQAVRNLGPGQRLRTGELRRLLEERGCPTIANLAEAAERTDSWMAAGSAAGLTPIPCTSPAYPRLLLELSDAPPVLWVLGVPAVLAQPAVAVVGARDCSVAAARVGAELARDLAVAGLVVVSGLARGVDAAAHHGALDGGLTVAVLGSGADVIYPAEHRDLASRVCLQGALVSEFLPGTRPKAWHFPRRNRIIAGLAAAVVVVEAGVTSGALITAREALDQGKEVMVVPGSVTAGRNRGGHALLKDGAALVEDAHDVLEVLRASPIVAMAGLRCLPPTLASAEASTPLDAAPPAQWAVGDEMDLDDLKELTGMHPASVLRRLLEWELAGFITRTPLGRFVRLCR